jgi:hypothetical protein
MNRDRVLLYTSLAFMLSVLLHGTDHLMQDRGVGALDTGVLIGGTLNYLLAVFVVVMVLRNHERAPLVAAFVGFYIAIGVSAAHLLPEWGQFSDPYSELSLGAWSWIVVLLEIGTGFLLGLAGLRAMRRQAPPAPRPA